MDPDKIKGDLQRPYNTPEEKKSPDKIDPEKFKKVMKVDESEETEKRKKRNLPKEEEEGADEEVQGQIPTQSPVASFSEFMSDKDELGNVFDKQSGGVRRQAAPQEGAPPTAPPSESISAESSEFGQESEPPPISSTGPTAASSEPQEEPQSPPPSSRPQEPAASREDRQPASPPSNQPDSYSPEKPEDPYLQHYPQRDQPQPSQSEQGQTSSSQQAQKPEQKEGEKKKKKKDEQDTSLLASQPNKKNLDRLKKKKLDGLAPEVKRVPGKHHPEKKDEPIDQKDVDKTPQKFEEGIAPPPKEKKEVPTAKTDEGLTGVDEGEKSSTKKVPSEDSLPKEKTEKEPLKDEMFSNAEEGPTKEAANGSALFKRFSPDEVRIQKMGKEGQITPELEGLSSSPSFGGGQGGTGQQRKKKDDRFFIEADGETAGIPLPSFENPLSAIVPPAETPAYSKLSPEVHELFEKMGGVMLIQQNKGITTTTMNINMPGSVFDGTQVILDQYSTAPNAFNIQLVGNSDSVKVFSQNLDALKESFKQANFNFETNILNPILSTTKRSPHLIRRKGSSGGKGGQGGKKGK